MLQESGLKKDLEEREKAESSALGQLREKIESLCSEKEELVQQVEEANGRLENKAEAESVTESVGAMERQIEVGQNNHGTEMFTVHCYSSSIL